MIQPQQDVNSDGFCILLALIFAPLFLSFLLFLSYKIDLYIQHTKLIEREEKIKFLERKIVKIKQVSKTT